MRHMTFTKRDCLWRFKLSRLPMEFGGQGGSWAPILTELFATSEVSQRSCKDVCVGRLSCLSHTMGSDSQIINFGIQV